jgi:hypothetical protein
MALGGSARERELRSTTKMSKKTSNRLFLL